MPYNYYYRQGEPTYTSDDLEIEHKGFKIIKDKQYDLYAIKPPLGRTLHKMLEGAFTKSVIAKGQIDDFLEKHQPNEAYPDKDVPPAHVGRPTKAEAKERRKIELETRLAALLQELD